MTLIKIYFYIFSISLTALLVHIYGDAVVDELRYIFTAIISEPRLYSIDWGVFFWLLMVYSGVGIIVIVLKKIIKLMVDVNKNK